MQSQNEAHKALDCLKTVRKHQRFRLSFPLVLGHLVSHFLARCGQPPKALDEDDRVTEVDKVFHHLLVLDLELQKLVKNGSRLEFDPSTHK
jgi:hypothetical protein